MIYRYSYKQFEKRDRHLFTLSISLFFLSLLVGIVGNESLADPLALASIALLIALPLMHLGTLIVKRTIVDTDEHRLKFKTWFSEKEFRWTEISEVRRKGRQVFISCNQQTINLNPFGFEGPKKTFAYSESKVEDCPIMKEILPKAINAKFINNK